MLTAFTSLRINLSPHPKGCREWDASTPFIAQHSLHFATISFLFKLMKLAFAIAHCRSSIGMANYHQKKKGLQYLPPHALYISFGC
eukprot:1509166-Prorocentrum_lima.AAC.1